ncbi:ExeM/NucH family extracellular endonuclease [Agromyces arachidis]|uniref:ExeM/NucH family extracellular endonuclease n=1 Tax=Agromyces arachidis TaxID=766966 RepID=UPI004055E00E
MKRPYQALAGLAAGALAAAGLAVPAAYAADVANELIISEVVEGSSNNKAVEIANLTANPIDLGAGQYALKLYFNGNTAAGATINLTGTVAAGDVHVLAASAAGAAILAQADQTTSASLYNGDDAIVLEKAGVVIDSFGQVGFDPGTEWGTGLTSTADNTLRRNASVCSGDTVTTDVFDPSVQWAGFATDTFDGLGAHTADCEAGSGGGGGDGDGGGDPEGPTCDSQVVAIGAVQGSGTASPVVGSTQTVRGVVVGDFQVGGFNGYYLQDSGDGDAATSDGLFVYAPGGADVSTGDLLTVTGTVGEFFGATQITASEVLACDAGVALPAATTLELPATAAQREALEGMLVTMPQSLSVLEYFNYGRYGEIALGTERQFQPTAVYAPGSAEAVALATSNQLNRITLDDGRSNQNPDPLRHPDGDPFSLENRVRGGDLVTDLTGVLDYRNNTYKIQPTQPADYTTANPRGEAPEVGGSTTVASFNVLNYFTSLDERGAETAAEFERQEAKIVDAIARIDADIVGLIEIENSEDGEALNTLVAALNEEMGAGTYEAVETGKVGTDEITTAFIYKPATVERVGDYAILDSSIDPRFDTTRNRPALAQTFAPAAGGEEVTVVVNHFKSKGSACAGDPDTGDGQGNCNGTRTLAAEALADWLATAPTGAEAGRELIIGDLNSYDKEDPITALRTAGYTDLLDEYVGEYAYSYVFDGQLGYLDHGLAAPGLLENVTGAAEWAINADEPSILDYNTNFKSPGQVADWYAPDAYRSSDHDPVLIGLDLTPPQLEVVADPSLVFPPNNKWRTVDFDITASDDSGEVDVELVEIIEQGPKADSRIVSDEQAEILARFATSYTFVFVATDPSGNSTTQEVTVRVVP